jgi:multisite-specific tRNA:(cytosine-C5)-methyltransferase
MVSYNSLRSGLTVPLWKAKNSMSMMIAKKEKTALSNRIWGKDLVGPTPYGGNVHSKPPIAASAVSAEAAVPVEEKAEEAEGIEEAVMEETGAPDKAI